MVEGSVSYAWPAGDRPAHLEGELRAADLEVRDDRRLEQAHDHGTDRCERETHRGALVSNTTFAIVRAHAEEGERGEPEYTEGRSRGQRPSQNRAGTASAEAARPFGRMPGHASAQAPCVSRETLLRLERYRELLLKWQRSINLVSESTLATAWRRHFVDSAQLMRWLPPDCRTLADLGSGAGFPGLVLAILGVPEVHVIESDQRKVAFLHEIARETATAVTIHNRRAEAVSGLRAQVVTARALAPLTRLLALAHPLLAPEGVCLFLKGQNVDEELTAATQSWKVTAERLESISDPRGVILRLSSVQPA